MLFLARLLTALVVFCLLGVVLYVVASAVMGGIAGGMAAAAQHPTGADVVRVSQTAALEMTRKYGTLLLLGVVGVSAAVSSGLAFGGAFPWCRRGTAPPPLPGRFG